jgi:hypothetical protein
MIGNCYRTHISTGLDSLHPANWSAVHGQALYLEIEIESSAGSSVSVDFALEIDSRNPEPGMSMP